MYDVHLIHMLVYKMEIYILFYCTVQYIFLYTIKLQDMNHPLRNPKKIIYTLNPLSVFHFFPSSNSPLFGLSTTLHVVPR